VKEEHCQGRDRTQVWKNLMARAPISGVSLQDTYS